MFVSQPWSEYFGSPWLDQVSERFTSSVSATFIGGFPKALFNLTTRSVVNGNTISKSILVFEDFGNLSITLSGRGALSVDNVLTESVTLIFPLRLEQNMTRAKVSFFAGFSTPWPQQDNSYGFPVNAIVPLSRSGFAFSANGTKVGIIWKGSETVTFAESGALGSNLFMKNFDLTYPSAKTGQRTLNTTDITGIFPSVIEIGSEAATSSIRNNDWQITLTFAILFFAVVDLGPEYDGHSTQDSEAKPKRNDNGPQDVPTKVDSNPERDGKHEEKTNDG